MAYSEIVNDNKFKNSFKYYKQKNNDFLNSVITFETDNSYFLSGEIKNYEIPVNVPSIYGVLPSTKWKAFSISKRPGLLLIRNPFTKRGQQYWIVKCLRDFTRKPNLRNTDIDNDLKDIDQLWGHCSNLDRLRWATLGYHHNWDTKVYSEDRKSDFPPDLYLLSQHFAKALGYPTFEAESAIVNFYHPSSSLSGHVDRSEVELNAPLLSFSFGQSAIFLVGGTTLNEEGTPLLLQSGDLLLMTREARLCYHAVPRIVPTTILLSPPKYPDWPELIGINNFDKSLIDSLESEEFWSPFENFISRSRININVRQVLPTGQRSIVL